MKTMQEVDYFLKILMQAEKVLKDFNELSKKKPNDAVNRFKLSFVNTILEQSNSILDKDNKPFNSFNTFSEDDVPTNSDVVLILSQYLGCLKKYGRENTRHESFDDYWVINGKISNIIADLNKLR